MKRILLFLIFSAGAATAVFSKDTTQKIQDDEGKHAYAISCSGRYSNWGMCYKEASNVCRAQGYAVLDKQFNKTGYGSRAATNLTITRKLIIRCGSES